MATDTPAPTEAKSKPNVLRILIYFLAGVILMTTAALNLLVVYVLFAPDTFPKPIYLMYQLPVGYEGTGENGEPIVNSGVVPGGSANPIAVISGHGTASPEANSHAQPAEGGEIISAESENISPGQGIMIDTGTKIVNLAEPGGKKFIRVTATLEFAPPAGYHSLPAEEQSAELAAFMSEINAKVPVLDDTIVTLLSSKDFQSVYTTEGKDILRQEIMEAVNRRLPDYKVIYVYFKEFVMQ